MPKMNESTENLVVVGTEEQESQSILTASNLVEESKRNNLCITFGQGITFLLCAYGNIIAQSLNSMKVAGTVMTNKNFITSIKFNSIVILLETLIEVRMFQKINSIKAWVKSKLFASTNEDEIASGWGILWNVTEVTAMSFFFSYIDCILDRLSNDKFEIEEAENYYENELLLAASVNAGLSLVRMVLHETIIHKLLSYECIQNFFGIIHDDNGKSLPQSDLKSSQVMAINEEIEPIVEQVPVVATSSASQANHTTVVVEAEIINNDKEPIVEQVPVAKPLSRIKPKFEQQPLLVNDDVIIEVENSSIIEAEIDLNEDDYEENNTNSSQVPNFSKLILGKMFSPELICTFTKLTLFLGSACLIEWINEMLVNENEFTKEKLFSDMPIAAGCEVLSFFSSFLNCAINNDGVPISVANLKNCVLAPWNILVKGTKTLARKGWDVIINCLNRENIDDVSYISNDININSAQDNGAFVGEERLETKQLAKRGLPSKAINVKRHEIFSSQTVASTSSMSDKEELILATSFLNSTCSDDANSFDAFIDIINKQENQEAEQYRKLSQGKLQLF